MDQRWNAVWRMSVLHQAMPEIVTWITNRFAGSP
jgi:hypothetical protein